MRIQTKQSELSKNLETAFGPSARPGQPALMREAIMAKAERTKKMTTVIDGSTNCMINVDITDTRDTRDTEYVYSIPQTIIIWPKPGEEWFPVTTPDGGYWGTARFADGKLEI